MSRTVSTVIDQYPLRRLRELAAVFGGLILSVLEQAPVEARSSATNEAKSSQDPGLAT
jgi:hypothetical protein